MYTALLIIHFLGLTMGVGLSITLMVQGAIADRLPPEVAGPAMGVASRASIIGPIGLVLMILSGAAMTWLIGDMPIATDSTGFLIKMALVVVLSCLIAGAQYNGIKAQNQNQDGPPDSARIGKARAFAKVALPVSLLTMITAVVIFN